MTNENVPGQLDGGRLFSNVGPAWVEVEFGEFPAISDRAKQLLSQEGVFDVAFKKSISVLENDDFVSFANSAAGGAILIGVDRVRRGNCRPRGALVGCPIGDRERLKILAKANQCVPPVRVAIFVENRAEKPFYRIEIPSGPHKPYCTSGGTYKSRGDGLNVVLYPAQLLTLFQEAKGGEFVRWFQPATAGVGSAVQEAKPRIAAGRGHWKQSVWDIERNIAALLEAPLEAASPGEDDGADSGALLEGATESDVRLSSQDLCGFLMRLP